MQLVHYLPAYGERERGGRVGGREGEGEGKVGWEAVRVGRREGRKG